jgi:hypothetical protein
MLEIIARLDILHSLAYKPSANVIIIASIAISVSL